MLLIFKISNWVLLIITCSYKYLYENINYTYVKVFSPCSCFFGIFLLVEFNAYLLWYCFSQIFGDSWLYAFYITDNLHSFIYGHSWCIVLHVMMLKGKDILQDAVCQQHFFWVSLATGVKLCLQRSYPHFLIEPVDNYICLPCSTFKLLVGQELTCQVALNTVPQSPRTPPIYFTHCF